MDSEQDPSSETVGAFKNSYSQAGSRLFRWHEEPSTGFVIGQILRGLSLILSNRAAITSAFFLRRLFLRARRFSLRLSRFSIFFEALINDLVVVVEVRRLPALDGGTATEQHNKINKRRSGDIEDCYRSTTLELHAKPDDRFGSDSRDVMDVASCQNNPPRLDHPRC
mmetsp:Transcript_16949/g.34118  ORF Transcript_16949/g.34118 Transcript_16949/m.34118 type:complete len:167 (+) Transcript_16949:532-1032(+)